MSGECRAVYVAGKKEFVGTMQDGKKIQGKMTFQDLGKTYDGEWSNDKPHGQGSMTLSNGDTYTGEFVDGRMHGKGCFLYVSQEGRKYEGEFANDRPHGRGVMTMPNGKAIDTTWDQGKQTGGTSVGPMASAKPVSTPGSAVGQQRPKPQDPPPPPETKTVETYENQRTFPFLGYGKKMLPTDRPPWSDKDGKLRLEKDAFVVPEGWTWSTEWLVVGGGKDGWEYATDFYLRYTPKEATMDCVRRRCWQRTMTKKQ